MGRAGPPYPPGFRAEAVHLLSSSGKTVAEVSRELGVSEATLRRWRLQAGDEAGGADGPTIVEPAPALPSPATPLAPRTPGRRPAVGLSGRGRSARMLARLAADVIDVGVAVVTAPARWTASGLRWYAGRQDGPPRSTG
jgi:transposase-like protein